MKGDPLHLNTNNKSTPKKVWGSSGACCREHAAAVPLRAGVVGEAPAHPGAGSVRALRAGTRAANQALRNIIKRHESSIRCQSDLRQSQ